MKKFLKILSKVLLFCFLTLLTQIGGVIYLLSLLINKLWKKEFKLKILLIFIITYLFFTFLIVPFIAPVFGREKVVHSDKTKPSNHMTVLLNRNYVVPELNDLLLNVASSLSDSKVEIRYLDANFPFINRFPLLPHLSHNDGKKIDISLVYEVENGEISNKQKSISGYGVFEKPRDNEQNQIDKCLSNGYFQYDYPKYLTFGKINSELRFSEKGTKKLIDSILKNNDLGKIFNSSFQ